MTAIKKAHKSLSVLGCGAWGTALAAHFAHMGHDVILWGRNAETIQMIHDHHKNERYLPEILLPRTLKVTTNLEEAAQYSSLWLSVVPVKATLNLIEDLRCYSNNKTDLVLCSKGLEPQTQRFLFDIIEENKPFLSPSILSGPSFALDVVKGLPTALTLASASIEKAQSLCQKLHSEHLRPYASTDRIGVSLGGALKNIFAIACGVCAGAQLGASAHASLLSRSFKEMQSFGTFFGADEKTLTGLSGLGDLILTASSTLSRNYQLGYAIGSGEERPNALAEGALTAKSAFKIARSEKIEAPVIKTVCALLDEEISVKEALKALMTRPLRQEF